MPHPKSLREKGENILFSSKAAVGYHFTPDLRSSSNCKWLEVMGLPDTGKVHREENGREQEGLVTREAREEQKTRMPQERKRRKKRRRERKRGHQKVNLGSRQHRQHQAPLLPATATPS